MVVDINVSYTFNMGDTLRSVVLVVDDTVDGKDIYMEETREVGDIMMYHFSKNHWSSTSPCWRPSPLSSP